MRGRADDFWHIELTELMNAIKGFRSMRETDIQRQYEIARMMGLWTIMPHSKKALKPTDLLLFPWEKIEKPKVTTTEERDALIARIKERDAKSIISVQNEEII